jgi:hypothetical protein
MATLAQLPRKYLENLLTTNKSAQYFPLNVSDYPFPSYPQGVPRSAVVTAYLTAAMQYGNFQFVQLGGDDFARPAESPLSQGGNWTNSNFETANAQAFPINTAGNSSALYTGTALPANQWASVTIGTWGLGYDADNTPAQLFTVAPTVSIQLRGAASNGGGAYNFCVFGGNLGADSVEFQNRNIPDSFGSADLANPIVTGDVFLAAVVGSTLLFYRNEVLVASASDSNLVGGYAGIFADLQVPPAANRLQNYEAISNFACGAVIGAPNLNVS